MGTLGVSRCPIKSAIRRQTAHTARSSPLREHLQRLLLAGLQQSQIAPSQTFACCRLRSALQNLLTERTHKPALNQTGSGRKDLEST